MQIVLLRHSQVIEKYQGKYNGHIDISLSDYGKNQAKEIAFQLKDIKFDTIYCSDLKRTKETLDAFTFDIKPIFTEKLREKSWGIDEGKSFQEIEQRGISYINFEQWISALDGEDITLYQKRIKDYFYKVIFKQKSKNILVVTHSGVIKTLLGIINNLSLEEAFSQKLSYGEYVVIEVA